jgi:hypothetical protein
MRFIVHGLIRLSLRPDLDFTQELEPLARCSRRETLCPAEDELDLLDIIAQPDELMGVRGGYRCSFDFVLSIEQVADDRVPDRRKRFGRQDRCRSGMFELISMESGVFAAGRGIAIVAEGVNAVRAGAEAARSPWSQVLWVLRTM